MNRKRTYKQYLSDPFMRVPRETNRRSKHLNQVSFLLLYYWVGLALNTS